MCIATSLGWHTGARSDDTIYDAHRPLYLLDCHWTEYDWPHHLAVARAEHPALAAVPDVLAVDGVPLALAQAEGIAPHCGAILVIPKAVGVVELLPRSIGGTPLVLGYSVPTKYGSTEVPVWCFHGWPVHLLGGTPLRQIRLAHYMDVVSADGNMCQKMAHRGLVFTPAGVGVHIDTYERRDGVRDMPARALSISLANISALWRSVGATLEARGAVA